MESNGEPGKILVSEDCKSLLEANYGLLQFKFNKHKDVEVPNYNKKIPSYFLEN